MPCGECVLQELPGFAPRARSCLSEQRTSRHSFQTAQPDRNGTIVNLKYSVLRVLRGIAMRPPHRGRRHRGRRPVMGHSTIQLPPLRETRSVGHDIQSEAEACGWLATSAGAAARTPASHCGFSAELLRTQEGCQLLYTTDESKTCLGHNRRIGAFGTLLRLDARSARFMRMIGWIGALG